MTFVKCQKCGLFLEYDSGKWSLRKGRPICHRCCDIQSNQKNIDIQRHQKDTVIQINKEEKKDE